MPDMIFFIYGGIFLAVLLAVEGLFMLVASRGPDARVMNRRMQLRKQGHSSEQVLLRLRREAAGAQGIWPFTALDRLIAHAGLVMRPFTLVLVMVMLGGVVFLALVGLRQLNVVLGLLVAVPVGIGLPLLYLRHRRRRRIRLFTEQLPDAVDMVVRSLRAGHPTSAALRLVSEQMPDPIGSELGIVVDEMTYGLELREALENLGRRVDSPELLFMIVAVRIQIQSGGNLAEVLSGLSKVMRDRTQLVRKVRAISAEGRVSAYMVSAMPFVVGGIIHLSNPTFFGDVAPDPLFPVIMSVLGTLLVVGIVWIFRMVNFRI